MNDDGKVIRKKVLNYDWDAIENFDAFFTEQEGFPVNNYNNFDAYFFSLLMTRMHLAEFAKLLIHGKHITFFFTWLDLCGLSKQTGSMNWLGNNWSTFVERFSVNLCHGSMDLPANYYVKDIIEPLVVRVLKARQCYSIRWVDTPFSRIDQLLQMGFRKGQVNELLGKQALIIFKRNSLFFFQQSLPYIPS